MLLEIINESLSLFVALCTGVYAYAYMSRFTKLLFSQLVTWLAFYIYSHVLTHYQVIHDIKQNNHWLFNIHMLFETLLLVVAARSYFKESFHKMLCVVLYSFFLIVWITQEHLYGLFKLLNYAQAAESLVVIILYLLILYDAFAASQGSWKTNPAVWAGIGLLLYFAGITPYMSLINYLNDYYLELSKKLFNFTTDVLANVRYFLLALAFFLVRKNKLILNP